MNLADEMPPARDDASGAAVLRLHWKPLLGEPSYARPQCCCPPPDEDGVVVNAGCQVHGLKSYDTLRSPGATVTYGLGR